jgi:hypothetical protein
MRTNRLTAAMLDRGFRLPVASFCAVALVFVAAAAAQENAYVALFDGSLAGWTVENSTAGNFKVGGGALVVEGPQGWLRSQEQYADFEIVTEFRFLTDDGDSGLLVRVRPDGVFGRGWPTNSYQIQLLNPSTQSRFPPLGALFRHGTPAGETLFDPEVARRAFTGTGEWQTLVVEARGDELKVQLNGVPIMQASDVVNSSGYIGLQGETSALEFRKIEIRELESPL